MLRSPRSLALAAPAVALGLLLAGCSGGQAERVSAVATPDPTSTYTAEVPVLVPGAPGEEPTVVQPGEQGTVANPDYFEQADVEFMTGMVGHHAQALEMAELAPGRAADPRVVALAERIAAAQGPEIDMMQGWLAEHGLPAADPQAHGGGHGGHGGDLMPGMATPEQMARLVAAEGAAFDRLFLELMTAHHRGALEMAASGGAAKHPVVVGLVDDVAFSQGVEIDRMRDLLDDLA